MRSLALTALLLPALLAGCLAGTGSAPVATGQIDGAVVDQLLRPFANQTVYLAQLGWRDSTSALGGFTFRHVPVGSYTILTAHEGTHGAAVTVTVEENRITKTILQLMPVPSKDPYMAILPSHAAFEDVTWPGQKCLSCSWTIQLDGKDRPAEVVFDARWDQSGLGGDGIVFELLDDKGDILWYHSSPVSPPFTATIDGADIPADAQELRVQAWFAHDFTPRANFHLDSFLTLYYGATRAELFGPSA